MKDYQRAINNFKYALTLTEDIRKKKMIWFDLGDAYMVSGQYKDAIERAFRICGCRNSEQAAHK
jgi:OOP family OmpA-OmpF porin